MPTLNINPNTVVVQTAAQWAVDATVYSERTFLITSDQKFTGTDFRKFKLSDGAQAWAGLDYLPIDAIIALGTSLQTQINNLGLTEVLLANNISGGSNILLTLNDRIDSENSSGASIDFGLDGNEINAYLNGYLGNAVFTAKPDDVSAGYGANYWWIYSAEFELSHGTKIKLNSPLVELSQGTASRFVTTDASKRFSTTKTIPSGMVVGDTDIQTLTNKTIDGDNNTVQDLSHTVFKTDAGNAGKFIYFDASTGAPTLKSYEGYVLDGGVGTNSNPQDSLSYYVGFNTSALNTNDGARRIIPLHNSILEKFVVVVRVNGATGTNENVTLNLRKNSTTNTSLGTMTWDATLKSLIVTGLSISFNGTTDFFELLIDTPAWATNPTNILISFYAYFRPA